MPPDLHALCEELRQIGLRPATPAKRKKIEDAVSSKWDGVKVAAATALSQWGDPQSVQTLKDLLVAVAAKPDRYSAAGTIARLLASHLQPSDLDWAVDVFIHQSHTDNRFVLESLFEVFPPNEVLKRLETQTLHGRKPERDLLSAIFRAKWRLSREKT
ncbi:MAG: hypothetical protein EPN97_16060 [Alphaproteobacteria bacterium]|nr:MAG: hypothetical protein EPN97_16060 [Alphaproteobacteria bacterium]